MKERNQYKTMATEMHCSDCLVRRVLLEEMTLDLGSSERKQQPVKSLLSAGAKGLGQEHTWCVPGAEGRDHRKQGSKR